MALTPDDVRNAAFTSTRFQPGYNEEQVDAFLDKVEAELERLYGENQSLLSENVHLKQQLAASRGQQPTVGQAPQAARQVPPPPPTAAAARRAQGYGGSIADTMWQ